MIFFIMFLKAAAWSSAFWAGIRCQLKGMLLWTVGITVFLTLVDELVMAKDVSSARLLLSLVLYLLMSFLLVPLAWKLKNPAVSMACNVMGTWCSFFAVNVAVNFGLLPQTIG